MYFMPCSLVCELFGQTSRKRQDLLRHGGTAVVTNCSATTTAGWVLVAAPDVGVASCVVRARRDGAEAHGWRRGASSLVSRR
jgi:cytochrome P450